MKLRNILGGLLLAFSGPVFAASIVSLPRELVVDSSGTPRSGAQLYVYQAGTTTPLTIYTTAAANVAQSNPVSSTASGLFPAIYLGASVSSYKLVLKDSSNVTIYTEDNIPVTVFTPYPQTSDETSAGVTATDTDYPVGHSARYGATCDGVADDTAEIQAAIDVASEIGGRAVIQTGTCLVDTLTLDASNVTIEGDGRGSILKASSDIPASGAILLSLAGGSDTTVNQALLDGIYGASVQAVRTNVTGSLENVQIKNLTFEGNSVAVRGIWMTGFTRGSVISGSYFNNIDGCGICLNGSWSFTLLANHIEGDGTNGTGIGLGQVSFGERGGSSVVNAANVIGNEVTAVANGMIWNFGVGGFVGGNTFEANATDGFASQSVEGLTVTGNYFEGNGGDNLDMGGTACDPTDRASTDCAESWIVAGNTFTNTSGGGNNIRIDGAVTSTIGPNNFAGTRTQHYFLPTSASTHVEENLIWLPDISSTYVSNHTELLQDTNFFYKTDSSQYAFSAPKIRAEESFVTATGSTLGFFGTAAASQQADIGALTDSTGGTPNDTVAAISGSGDDADINNNFADLADAINDLRTVLRAYGLMP